MDTIRSTATLGVVVVVMTSELRLFLNNNLIFRTAQSGWNVKLTNHLIPVENLRTSVAILPLSHVPWRRSYGQIYFIFTQTEKQISLKRHSSLFSWFFWKTHLLFLVLITIFSGDKIKKIELGGHVARMGERSIQGFGGETWRKETIWKTQA